MRQPDSLFNHSCTYVNTVTVGNTFTSAEYITAIGHNENVTHWKRSNKNLHYTCHQYKGYLKRAGFISNVKRGTWKVERHIPEWFDHGHLSILLCYYKWDSENQCNILTYKGMNRADIIARLDEAAHRAMRLNPLHKSNHEKIIQNLTTSHYNEEITKDSIEKIKKVLKNKNYIQTANKIDNHNGLRVESNSATQPNLIETKKTLHSSDTQEFSKNIALLESAHDLIGKCTTPDRFMQARLYNLQVLIQDIASAFIEKREFLTNN